MNRKYCFLIILLISTASLFSDLPEARAKEPSQDPEYYRGPNYSETVNPDGSVTWSSEPHWIYNGSQYVPYIYEDHYSTQGYYQVRTAHIGCRIYDYYAMFLNPNLTEVRVYDERWDIERWRSQGPGKWESIGAQAGAPLYTIVENEGKIKITKAFHSWAGWLNITYSFQGTLKHEIVFSSEMENPEQLGVVQAWAGIVGTKAKNEYKEVEITSATEFNGSIFWFLKADGNISVMENQQSAIEFLDPVIVETHAKGMKANFIFRIWSLNPGGVLRLDPATTTWQVGASSDDCYTYETTMKKLSSYVHIGYSSGELYAYSSGWRWIDVTIPQGSEINSAYLKCNGYGSSSGDLTVRIEGFDEDNTLTFSTQPNFAGRERTSATMLWTPGSWGNDNWYPSPDIKTIIQEIVNRDGWSSGNALGLAIEDTTGTDRRTASSWDDSTEEGAKLEVTYTPSNVAPTIGEFSSSEATIYANEWFSLNCSVQDTNGISEIVNSTVGLNGSVVLAWDNATGSFSVNYDPSGLCTLNSSACIEEETNSTAFTLSWSILLSWSYPQGSIDVISTNTTAYDSNGASGSGSTSGLFTFEPDIRVISATPSKTQAEPGESLSVSGSIYYQGKDEAPSNTTGLTAKLDQNGSLYGSTSSFSSGAFTISFNAPSSEGDYNFTVYTSSNPISVENQTFSLSVSAIRGEGGYTGTGVRRKTFFEEVGIPGPLPSEVMVPEAQYGTIALILILGGAVVYYLRKPRGNLELWRAQSERKKVKAKPKKRSKKPKKW